MRRRLPLRLAGQDALNEPRFFLLSALGLAAVLAPLLVLLALKHGVIDVLLTRLLENPANREITVALHGDFDRAFLDELARRPEVAFLVPQVRALSAAVVLANRRADPQRTAEAELLPTGPGDPLLAQNLPADAIALSRDLAGQLGATAGSEIRVIVSRKREGREERVFLDLKVAAVVERAGLGNRHALVPAGLLLAFEDYRDDRAVPALGWEGSQPAAEEATRSFSRFRLYARTLEDVEPLADYLAGRGIATVTQAAAIKSVMAMNRSLSTLFAIVAGLGGLGYLAALATSLWSNVERKRRTLSLLRLLGLPRWGLALFPLVQAGLVALCGFALALGLYAVAALTVNRLFAQDLLQGESLAFLAPGHVLLALAVTLLVALAAAGEAARRAARIDPAEGLRDV
ncbi:MAG TPA: FtsX-like permease family protein [Kiloniellales bacterium]|nr:FtsX-like permease family protein [Kiloniellales bacterium]